MTEAEQLQSRVKGIAAKKAAGREEKTAKILDRNIRPESFKLDGGPIEVFFWPRLCIAEADEHFPHYRNRLAP